MRKLCFAPTNQGEKKAKGTVRDFTAWYE